MALGAPLELEPQVGMASDVACQGRLRVALAPLVLLASLGLLLGGALLARWDHCTCSRDAILAGSSVAVPAAVLACLAALSGPSLLVVPLGDLGRLATGVGVRAWDALGCVLACGVVAGACGGALVALGKGERDEPRAWRLVGRTLVVGLGVAVASSVAGVASLGGVWGAPETAASLVSLRHGNLQELPRAGDVAAVCVGVAGQSLALECGGSSRAEVVVAAPPSGSGGAQEGGVARATVSLWGGLQGEGTMALPVMVRAGLLVPLAVVVMLGRLLGAVRRGEGPVLAVACALLLLGVGCWLTTWCSLQVSIPGVLQGVSFWAWWKPVPGTLVVGAVVIGLALAVVAPRVRG